MPIVARKTKPTLRKPLIQRTWRVKQGIPVPASPLPVARKIAHADNRR
jgi:hypothetical protein